MIDKIGGRKFTFGMMLGIMGFVLILMGKMDATQWGIFEASIGATYVIGNNIANAVNKKAEETEVVKTQ